MSMEGKYELRMIELQKKRVTLGMPSLVARQQRTNLLLFLLSITFFLSWLPFRSSSSSSCDFFYSSVFCLLDETTDLFDASENMMAFFFLFHIVGVSSACTNPVLYGVLNENFKKVKNSSQIYIGLFPNIEPRE